MIDRQGAPVAKAKVSVYTVETVRQSRARGQSEVPKRVPLAETETDARGGFNVAFDAAVANLQIEAEGHAPYATRVMKDEEIGACLLRPAARKQGTVSANGKPVRGARVVWSGATGAELLVVTGDDGRYSLPDPEVWATHVGVLSGDHALDEETAERSRKPLLDRELTRGVAIRGSVVAGDGTTPVANAAIFVDGWKLGASGDDGAFVIEHARLNWTTLRAVAGEMRATVSNGGGTLTLRLSKTSRITGVVRDAEGGGVVAGADVAAFELEISTSGRSRRKATVASAISDAKGTFVLELPAARYELGVASPGFEIAIVDATVPAAETLVVSIPLKRLARVTGRVVDEGNRPVAAAVVVPAVVGGPVGVGPTGIMMARAAVSGPDGAFVLRAVGPGDRVVLEAGTGGTASGLAPAMKLRGGETRTGVAITIPRGIEVEGFVTDPDRAPLAKVRVKTRRSDGGGPRAYFTNLLLGDGTIEEVVTNDEGRFALRLTGGEHSFWFGRDGFVSYTASAVQVAPGLAPLEITLYPGAGIKGRVVREGKGGVAGARVTLPEARDGNRSAITGPDGEFSFENLTRGTQRLDVAKEDELISITRVVEVPSVDLLIEVPRGESIEGRVIDEESGAAVREFSVGIAKETGGGAMRWFGVPLLKAFSDDDGRFRLDGIATGPVNLVAVAPGYVMKRPSGLTLEEGKPIRNLEITLARGTTIVGRVTDADGKPLDGVSIAPARDTSASATIGEPIWGEMATTDASGNYRLDAVGRGERTFRFAKDGLPSLNRAVKVAGRELRLDVQLSRGATIEGIVTTESGAPIEGAHVSVRSPEPSWADGRTGQDGRFRIEGVSEQRCDVSASGRGFVSAQLENVDPHEARNLRIVLKRGGRIRGRVTGLEPWEYAKTRVTAFSDAGSAGASVDSSGSFVFEAAPTGTVMVFAWQSSTTNSTRESERKRVELGAGGETSVDLEFRKGRTISGRVTRNGAPLAGASLRFNPNHESVRTRGVALTDDSGRYEVEGLDDGEYRVSVQPVATIGTAHSLTRTIGPATTSIDIDLETVQVRGRVSDAGSGQPVESARVVFERKSPNSGGVFAQRIGESDAQGNYVVDDMTPDAWVARAEKKGFAPDVREVDVGSSGATGIDFEIAESEGLRLLIVDGRTGLPVEARFRVLDSSGRKVMEGSTLAGGDGTRVALSAGAYRVDVWSEGYAPATVALNVPSADLSIALTVGGSLEIVRESRAPAGGRLVDQAGRDYLPMYWQSKSFIGLNPGSTTLNNITPGSYTLVVTDAAGSAKSHPVAIREGVLTKLTLGD